MVPRRTHGDTVRATAEEHEGAPTFPVTEGGPWAHQAFAKCSSAFHSVVLQPLLFTTPLLHSYLLRNLVSQFPGKAITFADKLTRSLEQSGPGGQWKPVRHCAT